MMNEEGSEADSEKYAPGGGEKQQQIEARRKLAACIRSRLYSGKQGIPYICNKT